MAAYFVGRGVAPANTLPASENDFALLTAMYDALDDVAGERIGGPTDEQFAQMRLLERTILATRAHSLANLRWKVRRLRRGVENEWSTENMIKLIESIGADLDG